MRHSADEHPYSRSFDSEQAVLSYDQKFSNAVDRLRHEREVELIGNWAQGSLFDCSVATGRFIGRLPKIRRYSGMDYSQSFLALVRARFPDIEIRQGDLLKPIEELSGTYDTVMCMRTLSALGHVKAIISEMSRIAGAGGVLIFDYGVRESRLMVEGEEIIADGDSIEGIIAELPLSGTAKIPLDGLLGRIKRWPWAVFAVGKLSGICGGSRLILAMDRILSRLWPARILYICAKI